MTKLSDVRQVSLDRVKMGTPVATLPGGWCYGVSAGTGWPDVSAPCLGESVIGNFSLSVAARTIV